MTAIRDRLKLCAGVLIDSNVLLDLAMNDSKWGEWSARALSEIAEFTTLMINPIIYAEVSVRFPTIESVEAALPTEFVHREQLPWEAAFLAAKCYVDYRKRGGVRTAPLPDFYIGAHAAVGGLGLLTRDAARYRTYFPRLEIFAP